MNRHKDSRVIFYSHKEETVSSQLKRVIELHFPKDLVIHAKTIKDFISILKKPVVSELILILFCARKDELLRLILYRDLLLHYRVILVLPDTESETLSIGHLIRPRFTTFVDGDMIEISAVLSKMLQRSRSHALSSIGQ
jgi:hypothetical protein